MMRYGFVCVSFLLVTSCSAVHSLNGEPQLSDLSTPTADAPLGNVYMPTPPTQTQERAPNALWDVNKRSFFRDQRADEVGDILTVLIDIADGARLRNSTARSRDNEENVNLGAIFGGEEILDRALANSFEPDKAVAVSSDSRVKGEGEINRNEEISLRVAAVVVERLANGNFVIAGHQEVRVNSELRELEIVGVIRPEDISSNNTIEYFKIAEARISYGGRGVITRVQKPRYGQRIYEAVVPY